MGEVTLRALRNSGGKILDRVEAGEHVTVTRDGRAVARLQPVARRPLSAATLIDRFRRLPPFNASALRADLDAAVDQTL